MRKIVATEVDFQQNQKINVRVAAASLESVRVNVRAHSFARNEIPIYNDAILFDYVLYFAYIPSPLLGSVLSSESSS